jgi:phage host-nuclease inhibitor protein Gam
MTPERIGELAREVDEAMDGGAMAHDAVAAAIRTAVAEALQEAAQKLTDGHSDFCYTEQDAEDSDGRSYSYAYFDEQAMRNIIDELMPTPR